MNRTEFQEIPHSGCTLTVNIATFDDGRRGIQYGVKHSAPTPFSVYAIYASAEGVPQEICPMGGMGVPLPKRPTRNSRLIFIGCDRESFFGHQCPKCDGYWRSTSATTPWPMVCPYCGYSGKSLEFMSEAQLDYIKACCEHIAKLQEGPDGEYEISLDKVTDEINSSRTPNLFYTQQSQQSQYCCCECGNRDDILGKNGYCSSCGTRNDLGVFKSDLEKLGKKLEAGSSPTEVLKDAVSSFDGFVNAYRNQLASRVNFTHPKRKRFVKMKFHDIEETIQLFSEIYDINLSKGIEGKLEFLNKLFQRRHIHEHCAGHIDKKYVEKTGDNAVKIGQFVTENKQDVEDFLKELLVVGENLHREFHEIIHTQQAEPIIAEKEKKERIAKYNKQP
ncbi:MAG: hypothetical protein GC129_05020 [Proteobacteria bacterium]|nr:hypothetical protein [Pseudomonadota bacterium]